MGNESKIVLAFVGDVFPGEDEAGVSAGVKGTLGEANATIINLEAPLTDGGSELQGKSLHLRSHPRHLNVVEDLSTSVACLANNHMCDWGPAALADTLQLLDKKNIRHTGAGGTIQDACEPAVIEIDGLTVGIIAVGVESIDTFPARESSFGCSLFDIDAVCDRIHILAGVTDIVVVAAHWGYTNYHLPLPEHVRAARRMVDEGATIVFGHHPHVVQGFEKYGRGAIVYSLGNFLFGRFRRNGRVVNQSRENRSGLICKIRVSRSGVDSLDFIHTQQDPNEVFVDLAEEVLQNKRNRFIKALSKRIASDNYESEFQRYVARRLAYRALRWCHPRMWLSIDRAYLQGIRNALRLLMKRNP